MPNTSPEEVGRVFALLDKRKAGRVPIAELGRAVRSLGILCSAGDIQAMAAEIKEGDSFTLPGLIYILTGRPAERSFLTQCRLHEPGPGGLQSV